MVVAKSSYTVGRRPMLVTESKRRPKDRISMVVT
jgi:hypothetical protein